MTISGGWKGEVHFGSQAGQFFKVGPGHDFVDAEVTIEPSDEGDASFFQVYLWRPDGTIIILESNRVVLFTI